MDSDDHRGGAILAICDRKSGFGAAYNDVAVTNYFNAKPIINSFSAKGHNTFPSLGGHCCPFSVTEARELLDRKPVVNYATG